MYSKKKPAKKFKNMWRYKGWQHQGTPRSRVVAPPLRDPPAHDPGKYGVRGPVVEKHKFSTYRQAMAFAQRMAQIGRSVGGPGAYPDSAGQYEVRVGR